MSVKSLSQRSNGYILSEDSERIVIATGFIDPSENAKTGEMIQIWILARAEKPTDAIKSGLDAVVCGDCPLRGINGKNRTCYVNVGQAPRSVWEAYQRGSYPVLTDFSIFENLSVRFGAYGDPVYIPFDIIRRIVSFCDGWTGYTHQWRNPLFSAYKRYVMASVETVDGMQSAHDMGWRTFRVVPEGTDINVAKTAREIGCVNTLRGIQCVDCGLCDGTTTMAKSIVIEAHGSGKKHLVA